MAHADRVSKDFCLRTGRKPYYYTKKRKEVKLFSEKTRRPFEKIVNFLKFPAANGLPRLQSGGNSCKIDSKRTYFAKERDTMKKFLTAALALAMLAGILGGCMCQTAETALNADGSGTVEAKFGFSEQLVNAMDMRDEMAENDFSYFVYQGRGYYGDEASESFANADEFNRIFAEVSAEIADVSGAATPGAVTLALASDGGLTLTVQNAQTDRRGAIKHKLAEQLPSYSAEQIDALLEGMVMTYRFTFPAALTQYVTSAGVTVEGGAVSIDYLALPAGTYYFSTSQTAQPVHKTLGTVAPENIPASGTALVRRQTVEIDGRTVTLQTYALHGADGGETNYVRLRDIASVLSGSAAQFGVEWDGSVVIVPQASYTPNGTEMQTPFSGDRRYQLSSAATKIYGQSIPFTAITLTDDQGGGYTYYKLRDLAQVLGFNVGWSNSRGIYIESSQPYAG